VSGWRVLSGLVLLVSAVVVLTGCADDGHLSRPFDDQPAFESSKDMRLVQVDLYRYTEMRPMPIGLLDRLLYDQFEIIDEPPLSFRFPDAYYDFRTNHKGGAQPQVRIHFDLDSMRPAPRAPIVFPYYDFTDLTLTSKPSHERTPKEAAEFNRRYVVVDVDSNRFEDGSWSHGALPSSTEIAKWTKARLANGKDGAKYLGIVNGMQLVKYTTKGKDHPFPALTPMYVGGIDINNNYIAAFAIDSDKNKVQLIDCYISLFCESRFIYHKRLVRFSVRPQHFLEIESIAQKIIELLDQHRLPPARKGEY
jgi:hypothetical protein